MQKPLPPVKHTAAVIENDWILHTFSCTSAVQVTYADDAPSAVELIISGHSITIARESLPALRAVIDALEAAQ